MECSCINQIFDLYISAMGSTRMVIEDQSIWMNDVGFSDALSINVSVKSLTRGGGIVSTIPLVVNKRNIVTAKELYGGNPGDCIKDDLYCFSIGPEGDGACGVFMSITRAFLPNAQCALEALIVGEKDEKDTQMIRRVEELIAKIEAQAEVGMVEDAKVQYKMLSDLLKGLICDCC